MWSSLIEHHRPTNVGAALKLLTRTSPRTALLAGGTWAIARRDPSIQAVVDLSALGLDFIEDRNGRLQIGAMTTLQTMATHPTVRQLAGSLLAESAQRSAPCSIRNQATLGGTLAVSDPTSEITLALLVLEARVVVRAPQRQTVSVEKFLENPTEHLSPSGLIVEIVIPYPETDSGMALAEVSRTPREQPIVNAVALVSLQGDVIRTVRLVLGGVAPRPIRLSPVEAALRGQALDEEKFLESAALVREAISPPSDQRASGEYRREMASVVAVRALREAWEKARRE